jgi:hypothetical protein
MSVSINYDKMIEILADRGHLPLVLAVGYVKIKELCLENIKHGSFEQSWIKSAMAITGYSYADVLHRFGMITYYFQVLESNKWKYP